MSQVNLCHCGSGLQIEKCCLQYISDGHKAPTAEALMRSRYTAYVLGDEAYLRASWHETTCPESLNLKQSDIQWTGLSICKILGGREGDRRGVVEFIAKYIVSGKLAQIHESSRFINQYGRWLYMDGDLISENTVSRNSACSCGSGKKFKRCCGKA